MSYLCRTQQVEHTICTPAKKMITDVDVSGALLPMAIHNSIGKSIKNTALRL